MFTNEEVAATTLNLFRESGAILEGHFVLTSGLHSGSYLEKFLVLQWPKFTEQLCRMIAARFRHRHIDVVAGPTTGGVVLAYGVARHLSVRGIFAERAEAGRAFRRGFSIAPGERVLVVDDVLTTGGSVRDVVSEARRLGGQVIAVAVLVDRSTQPQDIGAPCEPLLRLDIPTYQPERCPLCAEGLPITKPGSSEQTARQGHAI